MQRTLRSLVALSTMCVVVGVAPSMHAATIMRLNLGGEAENFQFDSGILSTIDDGDSSTSGDQNAMIAFMGMGEAKAASFAPPPSGSFTLSGMIASSPATTFSGSLMVQSFNSGNLAIYGADNTLLLSADVSLSAITGPLGPPNSQGLFLAFGDLTGGSMAPYLDPDSLRVKIKLPMVTGGFSVSPMPGAPPPPTHLATLEPFTATAPSVEILAEPIPEPASAALLGIGAAMIGMASRRRRPL
ncbi:MAG: PEP-CTERM sorting domain-containing protein [Planctomycetes bacterium]|nr:PEP-CTERM sorting domain-containing protein [Planctomycetota bacterium]